MAQPWPPGTEPGVPDADLGWVKPDGGEYARHWPDGPPGEPGTPDPPPDGGNGGSGGTPDGYPPPVASFFYTPPTPKRGDFCDYDGTASAPGDPAAPVTRYDWQFADKASMPDAGPAVTWRTPGAYGDYPVTLTVTAADGQHGTVTHVVSPAAGAVQALSAEPETRMYGGRA